MDWMLDAVVGICGKLAGGATQLLTSLPPSLPPHPHPHPHPSTHPTAPPQSLASLLASSDPPRRRTVMQHLATQVLPLAEKALLDPAPTHRALAEFMDHAGPLEVYDIAEMLSGPQLLRILHTRVRGRHVGWGCMYRTLLFTFQNATIPFHPSYLTHHTSPLTSPLPSHPSLLRTVPAWRAVWWQPALPVTASAWPVPSRVTWQRWPWTSGGTRCF